MGVELGLIVLVILIIASILDMKFKSIPSVFLTSILFVVLALRPENLYFGILGGVFALLFRDLMDSFGVADIKICIIIGLMIPTLQGFFLFAVVLALLQVIYVFLFKKVLKEKGEIPFVPCLLSVYIVLLYGGVIV